ncbi:hypothetical protein [Demequina salsinemoris]|uniref:hypothetical protein n=1 Tax=Demequina salsinemoris TaxID=577470 RepID=UPI000783DB8D|nr:hypothetical protein [Demequina salsinemoris]
MVVTYLVIGCVGLGIALLALIIGDLFDVAVDFVPDGALSSTSIAGTLAGFGFFGAAAVGLLPDAAPWVSILIAIFGAGLGWLLAWSTVLVARRQEQPEGAASLDNIVGSTGVIVEAPREAGMAGTVAVTFLGSSRRLHFRSPDELREGDRVVIDAVISTTQVQISRLTD